MKIVKYRAQVNVDIDFKWDQRLDIPGDLYTVEEALKGIVDQIKRVYHKGENITEIRPVVVQMVVEE